MQPKLKWHIETRAISDLKEWERNPRLLTEKGIKHLTNSINKFGLAEPVVINTNGLIIGGHARYKVLKANKETECECYVPDRLLTDEEVEELNVRLNANIAGEWDWEALANSWDENDLKDWGLELPFNFKGEAEEDNYVIPDEIETDIITGDLFEIGQHRLLCGDSTKVEDVKRLIGSDKAELLFTSPPYLDMRSYNGNKDLTLEKLIEFIPAWEPFVQYQAINLGIKIEDREIVPYWDVYIEKAKQAGYKFLAWNVWDKTQGGSIASATAMFLLVHEWIFVFGKEPKRLNRTVANQLDKYERRHGKDWDKGLTGKSIRGQDDKMSTTTSKTYTHHQLHSCVQQTPELGAIRKKHPAMFPVKLPSAYINALTKGSDIVAEAFNGSGSVMVACHQLNRRCYGMDLEPKYCQVTIDRMLNLDPTLEVKRNGKVYRKSVKDNSETTANA